MPFDIWLYSDETQPGEIRLADPMGQVTSTVHAAPGRASGAAAVVGAGVRIITIDAVGSAHGVANVNGSTRSRRVPSYAVSYSSREYWRRPPNTVDGNRDGC